MRMSPSPPALHRGAVKLPFYGFEAESALLRPGQAPLLRIRDAQRVHRAAAEDHAFRWAFRSLGGARWGKSEALKMAGR